MYLKFDLPDEFFEIVAILHINNLLLGCDDLIDQLYILLVFVGFNLLMNSDTRVFEELSMVFLETSNGLCNGLQ